MYKEKVRDVELNDTSKGILGENAEKLGTFNESTGGGTPLKKGEKLKDHPEAKRVSQPRDRDGQFTYNAVNGIRLKYGPSRGTTVPPILEGLKLTFCEKGTILHIEGPNGIQKKILTIDMSVEEIVNACKEYIEDEKGFAGMGEGTSVDMSTKGRKSKAEKEGKLGVQGKARMDRLGKGTKEAMEAGAAAYEAKNSANPVNPNIKKGDKPFVTKGDFQVMDDKLNSDGSTTRGEGSRIGVMNDLASTGRVFSSTAAKRPDLFKKLYPTNIGKAIGMTGGKATPDDIVKAMATGNYGTFAELREAIKNGSLTFGDTPAGAGAGAGAAQEENLLNYDEPEKNEPDNNTPDNNAPDNNAPDNNESDNNAPDNDEPDNNESDNNEPDNNESDNSEDETAREEEKASELLGVDLTEDVFDANEFKRDPSSFRRSEGYRKLLKGLPKDIRINPKRIYEEAISGRHKNFNQLKKWIIEEFGN